MCVGFHDKAVVDHVNALRSPDLPKTYVSSARALSTTRWPWNSFKLENQNS